MAVKHKIKWNTEVVNGLCQECNHDTVIITNEQEFEKWTVYSNDLKQQVHGKKRYIHDSE